MRRPTAPTSRSGGCCRVSIRRRPQGGLFGAVRSRLEQRGIVFVDFDELDQALNSEVGERQDAVFAYSIDPYQAVLGFHLGCDVVEPVLALTDLLRDEVDR